MRNKKKQTSFPISDLAARPYRLQQRRAEHRWSLCENKQNRLQQRLRIMGEFPEKNQFHIELV